MYEPYTWTTGEVITAEKLNHAEEGIEGAYEEVANVLPTYVAPTSEDDGDLGKALVVGRNGLNWNSNIFLIPTHTDENDKIRFDIPSQDWIYPFAYIIDGYAYLADTNGSFTQLVMTGETSGYSLHVIIHSISEDAEGEYLSEVEYASSDDFQVVTP